MKTGVWWARTILIAACVCSTSSLGQNKSDDSLRVVIIRHGEKPKLGDNLSCQGENRAVQLSNLLFRKFGIPANIYVPALKLGRTTKRARNFQTILPFAIKHNLSINSNYDRNDYTRIVKDVFKEKGTVLMVWQHEAIKSLAKNFGIKDPPNWDSNDFDSIWIINYAEGKAFLSIERQGIDPPVACDY